MNIDLSEEAQEYGRLTRRALGDAGGDRLVQRAEAEPDRREALVAPVLAELGAWDLDPRASSDELEAAAALCRSAGYWAVAYPVAERLCRPPDLDVDGLLVVADGGPPAPAGPVAYLPDRRWAAVTLDGERSLATPRPPASPPRKSAFATRLDLHPLPGPAAEGFTDVALGLVLPCWTLLGMLDRAIELTRDYVREREQFGQALASFQGVQFQLTDAEVERAGVEELAKYALWSVDRSLAATRSGGRGDGSGLGAASGEALADALALRLAALEAADVVFRVAHQLHGAIGFCDETTLSWVSRYSQPLRRLPLGLSATRDRLLRQIGRRGLSGLFDEASGRDVLIHGTGGPGRTLHGSGPYGAVSVQSSGARLASGEGRR